MTKSKNLKDLVREISSFMSCRLGTAILEIIFMNIVTVKLNLPFMIMKIVINIIVIILNFIFSKIFIFKKEQ
ncbi:GtrA-like protein [compost metagenome]